MNEGCISIEDVEKVIEAGEKLAVKLKILKESNQHKKKQRWLDNQDVCIMFRMSPKQLENLRSRGKIAYHKLGRKIYYKEEDVADFIRLSRKK